MEKIREVWRKFLFAVYDILLYWSDIFWFTIKGDLVNYISSLTSSVTLAFVIAIGLQIRDTHTVNISGFFYPYFLSGLGLSVLIVLFCGIIRNVAKNNRDLISTINPWNYINLRPYNPKGIYSTKGVGLKITNNNSQTINGCFAVIMAIQAGRDIIFGASKERDFQSFDKNRKELALPWLNQAGQHLYVSDQLKAYSSNLLEIANWDNKGQAKWSLENRNNNFPVLTSGTNLLVFIRLYLHPGNNTHVEDSFLRYTIEINHDGKKLMVRKYRGIVDEY